MAENIETDWWQIFLDTLYSSFDELLAYATGTNQLDDPTIVNRLHELRPNTSDSAQNNADVITNQPQSRTSQVEGQHSEPMDWSFDDDILCRAAEEEEQRQANLMDDSFDETLLCQLAQQEEERQANLMDLSLDDDVLNQAAQQEEEQQSVQDGDETNMVGRGDKPQTTQEIDEPSQHELDKSTEQQSDNPNTSLTEPPTEQHTASSSEQSEAATQPETATQPEKAAEPPAEPPTEQDVEEYALDNTAHTVTLHPQQNTDILLALQELEERIVEVLIVDIEQHQNIKWYVAVCAQYSKLGNEQQVITTEVVFTNETQVSLLKEEIQHQMPDFMQEIYKQSSEFQTKGSGWSLDKVMHLIIHTAPFKPLEGSSYIKLPKFLESKKAVLNIQNNDERCILWAILAHKHPVEQQGGARNRTTSYLQYEHTVNMNGISYPTPLAEIVKIEKNNELSINVFGYDHVDKIYPLYRSKICAENPINLLLIKEGEKTHYCLIKDFSRLMGHRTSSNGRQFFCFNCLHAFIRQDLLDAHTMLCFHKRAQKIVFPEKDKTVKFKNVRNQLPVPFIIYADFECYTRKIATCHPSTNKSSTTPYQSHEPSGFSYQVVCVDEHYTSPSVVYRGEDAVDTFFKMVVKESFKIGDILKKPVAMKITATDTANFTTVQDCHICDEPLGADRVRDHDHLTGKYRGAAHNECNLAYKFQKLTTKGDEYIIPVVFHNLRGYDGHLLMQSLGKYKKARIQCIPNNMERYISFSLNGLRFIDSFQFLGTSLEKLVANLAQDGKQHFNHLCQHFTDPADQDMLLRKGVFPYDYVDSPARLLETQLPTATDFYSVLNEEAVSEEDYAYAQLIWNHFKCKTLGDYHDLYLRTDVLLLADVFERFRKTAIETYKLDPAHYYTAPGMSWDSMLKFTQVELQLLDDPDMYLMVESGIRGGVSMITKKHAEANNPYVDTYDPSKPSNYLMYLDANNLYGWAMSQKMPEKEFDWMTEQQLEDFDVTQVNTNHTYLTIQINVALSRYSD